MAATACRSSPRLVGGEVAGAVGVTRLVVTIVSGSPSGTRTSPLGTYRSSMPLSQTVTAVPRTTAAGAGPANRGASATGGWTPARASVAANVACHPTCSVPSGITSVVERSWATGTDGCARYGWPSATRRSTRSSPPRLDVEACPGRDLDREPDVDALVAQRLGQLVGPQLPHLGFGTAEHGDLLEEVLERTERDRGRHGQTQRALDRPARPCPRQRALEDGEPRSQGGKQRLARGGGLDPAGRPVEQRDSEVALEPPHQRRHRLLAQVQPPPRRGEAPLLRDRHERPQLPQFDIHHPRL